MTNKEIAYEFACIRATIETLYAHLNNLQQGVRTALESEIPVTKTPSLDKLLAPVSTDEGSKTASQANVKISATPGRLEELNDEDDSSYRRTAQIGAVGTATMHLQDSPASPELRARAATALAAAPEWKEVIVDPETFNKPTLPKVTPMVSLE